MLFCMYIAVHVRYAQCCLHVKSNNSGAKSKFLITEVKYGDSHYAKRSRDKQVNLLVKH